MEAPLVSVVVVTYNSSKTILDTLNSIAAQTYKNIELIVSDDCSKDSTVQICQEWLGNHKSRFINTELLTVEVNTGTTRNLNRGYEKSKGIWIKGIAGDDVLMNNCIQQNVEFIKLHPSVEILFSKVKIIGDGDIIYMHRKLFKYGAFKLSNKEQLYLLLTTNFVPASTCFIKKDVFESLGRFDEKIPLLEDWPFWIKSLIKGKTLSFNDEYSVLYRMSDCSISLTTKINPLYEQSMRIFESEYLLYYQRKVNLLLWFYYRCILLGVRKPMWKKFLLGFLILINPIFYYIKYLKVKSNYNYDLMDDKITF